MPDTPIERRISDNHHIGGHYFFAPQKTCPIAALIHPCLPVRPCDPAAREYSRHMDHLEIISMAGCVQMRAPFESTTCSAPNNKVRWQGKRQDRDKALFRFLIYASGRDSWLLGDTQQDLYHRIRPGNIRTLKLCPCAREGASGVG
jgi:hypothetical protein